ncbi:hypothetical protein [Nocardioides sp. MH1]|uniref:hypothetical protein n=1 Tax=Nocardioides sp. MH1 TaxID=3242490 RepID=UPI003522CA6B
MHRILGVAVLAAIGLVPAAPASSAGAPGDLPTCAGLVVTIDLNDPSAPDPDRPESDVVLGTPEGDFIQAGSGADVICGGEGSDRIWADGDDVGDRIFGGGGGDYLYPGGGADEIRAGGSGDEVFPSGSPEGTRDEIHLGPGADTFFGTTSDELVVGGPGIDAVGYSSLHSGTHRGVTVDLEIEEPQDTGPGGVDELVAIEQVGGTPYDDVLRGTARTNVLKGRKGDDRLFGRGGGDVCYGGSGHNTFHSCEVQQGG